MGSSKNGGLISIGAALAGVLSGAAPTGLLVENAEAAVVQTTVRRREDEHEHEDPLLLIQAEHKEAVLLAGHSSHRSHSSHSSHSSHYSGSGGGWHYPSYEAAPPPPPPPPPKPAHVSFVVFPGGRIFVDGADAGHDSTKTMKLTAGRHTVRIENHFLGTRSIDVELTSGQTGVIELKW